MVGAIDVEITVGFACYRPRSRPNGAGEVVLECYEEDAREVALWLKEKMRSSIEDVLGKDLGGEKSVEVSYGPSWGETTEGALGLKLHSAGNDGVRDPA